MRWLNHSKLIPRTRRSTSTKIQNAQISAFLPYTEDLLGSGGDTRLDVDSSTKVNRYACGLTPDAGLLPYGSSTASTISVEAFLAAKKLRRRLTLLCATASFSAIYRQELDRIKRELFAVLSLAHVNGLEAIITASGTDCHLIASQLCRDWQRETLLITVDNTETGSGVSKALLGKHFNGRTALGERVDLIEKAVTASSVHEADVGVQVRNISLRDGHGVPRTCDLIDAEVEGDIAAAIEAGKQVILNLVDVSKTGLIAPSLYTTLNLVERYGDRVHVIVDCCQTRVSSNTIQRYLAQGFMVALTGSKFIGGPAFAGIILVPQRWSLRLQNSRATALLKQYCRQAEWPSHWQVTADLPDTVNFGLLLRWQAALEIWKEFSCVPAAFIRDFLRQFGAAINAKLQSDDQLESLSSVPVNRDALLMNRVNSTNGKSLCCNASLSDDWDQEQSIFAFVPHRLTEDGQRVPLNLAQAQQLYLSMPKELMQHSSFSYDRFTRHFAKLRCQLGQAVPCGDRTINQIGNVPVAALRLSVGARTIIDAYYLGVDPVISQAIAILDKAKWLANNDCFS